MHLRNIPGDIRWQREIKAETLECRACKNTSTMNLLLAVDNVVVNRSELSFYRCDECGSLNVLGELSDYAESGDDGPFTDHYLHVGAGIDATTSLLERVGVIEGGRCLDVGCGYGFALDYWRFRTNGYALGLEPTPYGARGASELNVEIRREYLTAHTDLPVGSFDRIISSEVIEHVPDPLEFVRVMKHRLAPAGILLLTTPSADYVDGKAPLGPLLAVLSPGLHQMLFSRLALERLLLRAGFRHVHVEIANEKLIAMASDAPMRIALPTAGYIRDHYVSYLKKKTAETSAKSALGLGVRYRLFKELVNLGRLSDAIGYRDEIVATVMAQYAFDPMDPVQCNGAVSSVKSFLEYHKRAPFNLPCFMFYAAMTLRHDGMIGRPQAVDLFKLAGDLCAQCQSIDGSLFQEAASLYWPSVFEEGFARLVFGDRVGAVAAFDRLRDGAAAEGSHLKYCVRSPELVQRAMLQSAVATLQMGEPENAMRAIRKCLSAPVSDLDSHFMGEALRLWGVAASQADQLMARFRTSGSRGPE